MLLRASAKTALIWDSQRVTYKQLLQNIADFSIDIKNRKAKKIAIFATNSLSWVYAFYAGWKADTIVVPIDHMSSAEEVAYILNDCKPEIVFTCTANEEKLDKALSMSPPMEKIVFQNFTASSSKSTMLDLETPDLNKVAVLIYTSGTTGDPKGVMLTFGNILTNINAVTKTVPVFTSQDRTMILLPLHHTFPLIGSLVAPLYSQGKAVFSKTVSPSDLVKTLQKHKITIIIGVPRLYEVIEKGIREKVLANPITKALYNVAKTIKNVKIRRKMFYPVHKKFGGHLRYLVSGGAALDPDVAVSFYNMGFEVLEGYGMTECAPMITFTRPGKFKVGSAGQLLDGVDVRFEDDEILVRGANVMKGYFNKPEETANVIQNSWLRTGDLGKLDKDKYLFITGRIKEMIVLSNGKNIHPEECERKIANISDVIKEVGVFSQKNALNAIIFPDFQKIQEQGILHIEAYIRSNIIEKYNKEVASYKRVFHFTIVKEELPKTRLSKVKRFLLPTLMHNDEIEIDITKEPTFKEYVYIKDYLARQTKKKVYSGAHLEIDLGMDSLDKVSLQAFLETTFGIKLTENEMANLSSVLDLANYIKDQKTKFVEDSEEVVWSEILSEPLAYDVHTNAKQLRTFRYFFKIFFGTYFKMHAKGKINIPDGPCIMIANHQSFFDAPFILSHIKPSIIKEMFYYAKEKHLRNKFLRKLAEDNNVIVMDLNSNLKASLQTLASVLKSGKKLLIFPEGTRTKNGQIGEFKKMFAILSVELQVPVLPIVIHGAYDALPSGKKLPKFKQKISVEFKEAIVPKNHTYDSFLNEIQTFYQHQLQ